MWKMYKFGLDSVFMDPEPGAGGGGADAAAAAAAKAEADAAAAKAASDAAAKAAADKAAADAAAVAAGGKKPTDEEARLLKEVMDKKAKLKEAEAAAQAANEKLKQFEGLNVDEIKAMVAAKKEAETKAMEQKGEWERLKQRMADEHKAALEATKTDADRIRAENARLASVVDKLSIGAAFDQSQFIKGELTLTPTKTRALYGDYFDVVDGNVVPFDKPRGAAGRTQLVDQYGTSLAFDAAIAKIVDTDPEKETVLKSKTKPGAGSGGAPGSRAPVVQQPGGKSSHDKIKGGLSALK